MSKPAVIYMHLSYEDYKNLEEQAKLWKETRHETGGSAFYHKAVRLKINDALVVEFHGPLVGGVGHQESSESSR